MDAPFDLRPSHLGAECLAESVPLSSSEDRFADLPALLEEILVHTRSVSFRRERSLIADGRQGFRACVGILDVIDSDRYTSHSSDLLVTFCLRVETETLDRLNVIEINTNAASPHLHEDRCDLLLQLPNLLDSFLFDESLLSTE